MKTIHTLQLPHLGIDISKLTFDVCLCLPDNSTHAAEFANDAKGFAKLDAWLKQRKAAKTKAGLEATGPYGNALLAHLHAKGHCVYQLNPRRVKDYARSQGRRVKTDRIDAAVIAAYVQSTKHLVPWQPPVQVMVDLQALVRRRAQVLDMLQAERNRAQASTAQALAASFKRQVKVLQGEIKQLNTAINKLVLENASLQKDMRLLRSIHGVGLLNAATMLGEVPQIRQFSRARDVAAFAGLTPALAQSGTSVRRRGAMTKEGSALLRKMLYMAALQAVTRTSNAFHKTYLDFVARGKAKMCAIGAIMHKILRVAFGVLKHNTEFTETFAGQ